MKIIMLGTGAVRPVESGRAGPAQVLMLKDRALLFDCGRRTTEQLFRANIDLSLISALFFTHHHFDHNIGYAHFVLMRWIALQGKDVSLEVYGPKGTRKISAQLFSEKTGVFKDDIYSRIMINPFYKTKKERWSWPVINAYDIKGNTKIKHCGCIVTAAEVPHFQPYLSSLAYRVDTDEGSVVISGDTGFSETLIRLAFKADVLIHDCTREDSFFKKKSPFDYTKIHSHPSSVGLIAKKSQVKKVVLTHISPESDNSVTLAEYMQKVKGKFKGDVYIAKDLLEITV